MDRRTKAAKLLESERPSGSPSDRSAPEAPVLEPRCNACRAGDREYENAQEVRRRIDDGLWRGDSPTQIKAAIDPLQENWPKRDQVSYDTIRRHATRHLQMDRQLIRALMQRHREHEGPVPGWAVPPLAAAELMVYRGTKAMVDGAAPSPATTLEAAKFLHEINREVQAFTLRDLESQVQDLLRITRAEVSPEQWDRIVARMSSAWPDHVPAVGSPKAANPGTGGLEAHEAGGNTDSDSQAQ